MRVSTNQQFISLQEGISRAQSWMAELQRQISSGKRLERPSDDAFAAIGVIAFRAARALAEQHQRNAGVGKDQLALGEAALGDMGEIMKAANTLVIQGANGATSQEARRGMAAEIRQLKARLLEAANSRDGHGRYLFAGFKVETRPFVPNTTSGPPLLYQGDGGKQLFEIGPGAIVQGNLLIDEEVIAAYEALGDAESRLEAGDVSGLSGVTLKLIEDASADLRLSRGDAGARIQRFSEAAEIALRRSDQFTGEISEREDADLAEVLVQLKAAQNAYEAALAAFSAGAGLSLLNYTQR